MTTLGMKQAEMKEIASIIWDLLKEAKPAHEPKTGGVSRAKTQLDGKILNGARQRVADLLKGFPLYPELVVD
jgi:glycine hydroxymethyltransferase